MLIGSGIVFVQWVFGNYSWILEILLIFFLLLIIYFFLYAPSNKGMHIFQNQSSWCIYSILKTYMYESTSNTWSYASWCDRWQQINAMKLLALLSSALQSTVMQSRNCQIMQNLQNTQSDKLRWLCSLGVFILEKDYHKF